MPKQKIAKRVPTVRAATGHVARAEQRHDRATTALEAAREEEAAAAKELNAARASLRAANRAEIDKHK